MDGLTRRGFIRGLLGIIIGSQAKLPKPETQPEIPPQDPVPSMWCVMPDDQATTNAAGRTLTLNNNSTSVLWRLGSDD